MTLNAVPIDPRPGLPGTTPAAAARLHPAREGVPAEPPAPAGSHRQRLAVEGRVERVLLQGGMHGAPALEVVILAEGVANGLLFGPVVLQAAAPLFNGVPVFVDHATSADLRRAGGRSVRDLAGIIASAHWDASAGAIRGTLSLTRSLPWLHALIADFAAHPALFGLSADLWLRSSDAGEGQPRVVTSIERVNSVDVVVRPAAGGRFITEGTDAPPREDTMPDTTITETAAASAPDQEAGSGSGSALLRVRTAQEPEAEPMAAARAQGPTRDEIVELALAASSLPEGLKELVREDGRLQSVAEVQAAIARLARTWADLTAQQAIRGLGEITRVSTPLDRVTLAFERLMGVGGEPGAWNRGDTAAHRSAPRLSGIREMYDLLTGDWERHGVFHAERTTFANATTTTMAEVVRNVLNKALVQSFEARPRWWEPIAWQEDLPTLQDARWITLGGFSDLDTVDEGNAYTEKTWDDYAETSPFVKKGNYLGLTLEMIDRDDVGAVRAIPRKLGQAAWRTLSTAVASLFTANGGLGPTLADGESLFHELAHRNLGTSPLDAAAWQATVTAMYRQTEYHSARTLGIRPSFCLVPIELEGTAVNLFTTTLEPGLAGNSRAIAQVNHSVIAVPEWTDVNNWAAVAHPADLPGVMIGYRFGRTPELFIADHPLMGSMFSHDELRVKVRFVYSVGIGDYRALFKHNVA
ncbi:MAG: hypothetical protein ACOX2L_00635 [Anaerolineae bacterium]|jgi:hypothetical protein|nr:hypothetical protein [Chloroflexota bacterium]